ncbi:hypothetical protein GCM10009868_11110 [Terrabacter aerolatus]|uniref:Uncharacterized protein n=1 Tax=Terrabacter aerolatus TaxID=422442 RepID=A0A512D3Z2_9MICO|nr:hypothetical protein [Terrabacter aerolatus]GEO31172.1 hypothetical protein TAE01_29820 [Terrabacter aerolatus]
MSGPESSSSASAGLRSRSVTLFVLAAAAASLALSLRSPVATAVIGVILFGVLHNLLELRYVVGRFSSVLGRPFLDLLVALVTGIVVCRLLVGMLGRPAQLAEIALGYAVLLGAAHHVLDGRRRVAAWTAIGVAAAVSLTFPAYHVVVMAHLHHVVVLFFLWEWSRRITSRRGRRAFRAVQLLWVVAVPVVVLSGLLDGSLTADPGMVRSVVGDGHTVLASSALPGTAASVVGLRLLTVLAFLQTMHYVVWVALMPRIAPDASAAFEARVPWVTGPRLWAVGFVVAAVFAVLFGLDFTRGTTVYAALSSYTAYVEVPVLLAMLFGAGRVSAPSPAAGGGGRPPGSGSRPAPTTPSWSLAPPPPLPTASGGSYPLGLQPEVTAAVAPDADPGA